jgi:hypothetical protein
MLAPLTRAARARQTSAEGATAAEPDFVNPTSSLGDGGKQRLACLGQPRAGATVESASAAAAIAAEP